MGLSVVGHGVQMWDKILTASKALELFKEENVLEDLIKSDLDSGKNMKTLD